MRKLDIKLYIATFSLLLILLSGCVNNDKDKQPDKETYNEIPNKIGQLNSNEPTISNRPPKMRVIRVVPLTKDIKDGFQAIATAVDPEGDPVNFMYQWKYNDEDIVGETKDRLQWREQFKKGGKISVEVIPFDDKALGIWKSEGVFKIPNSPQLNSPPVISSKPPTAITDGKFYYEFDAFDPDGDEMTYTLNNAPEGMRLNSSTKTVEWIPTEENKGNYKAELIVKDTKGARAVQLLDISTENL